MRQLAEAHLLRHLSSIPASAGLPAAAHRLAQASGAAPLPALPDCGRLALHAEHALHFNPFLSAASLAELQRGSRVWLQLCVLEDRLARLARLVDEPGQQALLLQVGSAGCSQPGSRCGGRLPVRGRASETSCIRGCLLQHCCATSTSTAAAPLSFQELEVHREWSVDEHPEWLVFEAEQRLQIRPRQYWVANYLIHNPGAIVQLNMGEAAAGGAASTASGLHWLPSQIRTGSGCVSRMHALAWGRDSAQMWAWEMVQTSA